MNYSSAATRLSSTPAPAILIVEDEEIIRTTMCEFLCGEGYQVETAGTVAEAITKAQSRDFNLTICDVQLPDGDGIGLLRKLRKLNLQMFTLIITAYATVENSIEAFKAGAFDYLVKPVIFEDLANKLQHLFHYRELHLENQLLRRELDRRQEFDQIVGSCDVLQKVQETIRKVAVTNSNVLLVGETGTGKELFARAIHSAGTKRDEKFLAVSCGTRPVELLERQLFGEQRESSTDNDATNQLGIFRHAGEGTIYLDEITQLPLGTQADLLRAIEYREIVPVGSAEAVRVNPRIIASTTRDLAQEVSAGRLQEDLFYRFDGMKIPVPPLRERLDDIPELVEFFIEKHSSTMGKRVSGATSETLRLLMAAQWKGNVRQLDNAIERAVMMCDATQIEPSDLPPDLLGVGQLLPDTDDLRSALRHYEKLHIIRVLKQYPEKREAAKRLKLGLSSLYRKIEEFSIDL